LAFLHYGKIVALVIGAQVIGVGIEYIAHGKFHIELFIVERAADAYIGGVTGP